MQPLLECQRKGENADFSAVRVSKQEWKVENLSDSRRSLRKQETKNGKQGGEGMARLPRVHGDCASCMPSMCEKRIFRAGRAKQSQRGRR